MTDQPLFSFCHIAQLNGKINLLSKRSLCSHGLLKNKLLPLAKHYRKTQASFSLKFHHPIVLLRNNYLLLAVKQATNGYFIYLILCKKFGTRDQKTNPLTYVVEDNKCFET